MYCKKCGKLVVTNEDICEECKQQQQYNAQYQNPNPYANQNQNPYANQNQNPYANQNPNPYANQNQNPYANQNTYNAYNSPNAPTGGETINLGKAIAATILGAFCWIPFVGLVTSILALIFGIQSIKNFKETAYTRSGKRIPVLILGICGVVAAGSGFIYQLAYLIMFL